MSVRFAHISLDRDERATLSAIEQRHAREGKAQAPNTDRARELAKRLLNYGLLDEVEGAGGAIGYVPADFPVLEMKAN